MPNNKQSRTRIFFCIAVIYCELVLLLVACSPFSQNSSPVSNLLMATATKVHISQTALPLTPTLTNTSSVKTLSLISTFGKFDDWVKQVVISKDGKILAAIGGKNDQLTVWNVDSGKELLTLKNDNDSDFALSADGRLLASTTWFDSWITILDTQSGQKLQRINANSSVQALAFSQDGKVLAIGGSSAIWLWSIENNTLLDYLGPESDSIGALAFSNDGKQLVSVGNHAVQLWDLNSRKALKTFRLSRYHMYSEASISPGNPDFLAISDASELDPNSAAYLDKNSVEIWDITKGSIIRTITEFAAFGTPMAISPDGRFLVVAQNTQTEIWDVSSGKAVYKFQPDWAVFAFSTDGDRLVVGNDNGTVELWNINPLK